MRNRYLILAVLCVLFPALAWTYPVTGVQGTGTITGEQIFDGTIAAADIADNVITSAKILDNTIATGKIADGTILAADIADNVITSAKILDNTVAKSKLNVAAFAVTILDNVANPTAAQMYNSVNVVNAAITVLLPTAVAGMNGCIRAIGADYTVIVDVQPTTDTIALLGAADTAGDGITSAAGTATGDFACVVATAANTWVVMQRQGTWAQQ